MNLTLIGMPGAGKSYIGKLLAERRGLEFLDVDRHLLEPTHGKQLQEILDAMGSERFMAWEEQLMIDHTKGKDGLLISPPGSIAHEPRALEHFRAISTVVYLMVPFETIEQRIDTSRGVVGLGNKTLRELYDDRTRSYERNAHLIVDTEPLDLDGVLNLIDNYLGLTR